MPHELETRPQHILHTLKKSISRFSLDLRGLTVFTEAATGDYTYTPILAALAGANKVFAFTRDTKYGSKEDVGAYVKEIARQYQCDQQIEIVFHKHSDALGCCDIVTNSGMVRPIDRSTIEALKPTAVIPLMWETWEWRPEELDLAACLEKNILVLGTNERHLNLRLDQATGFLAYKMMFDCKIEAYDSDILLASSCPTGDFIQRVFKENGVRCDRLAVSEADVTDSSLYTNLKAISAQLDKYDALIIAEHHAKTLVAGKDGILSSNLLKERNPHIQLIHICGWIDAEDLRGAGLSVYPPQIAPWGYMSMMVSQLGMRPVLDLNSAGLKVGEAMARARLQGMDSSASTQYALRHAPAMEFSPQLLSALQKQGTYATRIS